MRPDSICTALIFLVWLAQLLELKAFKHVTSDVKSSALLPCTGAVREGQATVNWTGSSGDHVVLYNEGTLTAGPGFENRVRLSEEGVKHGNFSLVISPVEYSDKGLYSCFYDGALLHDVRLDVVVPTEVSVPVGKPVRLLCYATIDRQAEDKQLNVCWEKEGELVLRIRSGSVTRGSGFENRIDVSKEDIRKGDLSLHFSMTRLSDQGQYQCFYNDQTGCLGRVTLRTTAHEDTLSASGGQSIVLPLHTTEPARVLFFGTGDRSPGVSVCVVEGGLPRCGPQYGRRVSIQNGSLQLQRASPSDSGVYRVVDQRTNITISATTVSVSPSEQSPRGRWIVLVVLVMAVVLCVVLGACCYVKRRRQELPFPQQETVPLSSESMTDRGYSDRCLDPAQSATNSMKISVPESSTKVDNGSSESTSGEHSTEPFVDDTAT